jgi:tRNA threonylcarbamoyladenosine biosynthesis protein TsaE
VSLIEWPERAGGLLPPADVEIDLESPGVGRNAVLTSTSLRGQKCLARTEERWPAS